MTEEKEEEGDFGPEADLDLWEWRKEKSLE